MEVYQRSRYERLDTLHYITHRSILDEPANVDQYPEYRPILSPSRDRWCFAG